ncbi:MAG: hypothetical protein KDE27_25750 [Planctomycetes bacterium]|nr:hypothetical protein [Planctomycetota bacterium]
MNVATDREVALARRLEWGLSEVSGGEAPPDVTAAVLARAAAGECVDVASGAAPAPPVRSGHVLAAALVLLGLAVVVGALVTARAGAPPPAAPSFQLQDAGWTEVVDTDAIATLPRETRSVELRNLDDTAVAALVARCPELQRLRVVATFSSPRVDDRQPAVSITDGAFDAIVKLGRLQVLELVGTRAVKGPGLQRLAELPEPGLVSLTLRDFDTTDDALAVLPRLAALAALDLSFNFGFRAAGVRSVAGCANLRVLAISPFVLDATSSPLLARLTKLEELSLPGGSGPRVALFETWEQFARDLDERGAGAFVEKSSGWPELRRLDLRHGVVAATLGRHLRETCPELRSVNLSHCRGVDDTTVAELVGLTHLQELDLTGCAGISEHCIPLLEASSQLRAIELVDVPFMTLALAERLLRSGKRLECWFTAVPRSGEGLSPAEFQRGLNELEQRIGR